MAATAKGSRTSRAAAVVALGVVVAPALAVAAVGPAAMAPPEAATPTVVSLTFDDGNATQRTAVEIMDAYGMDGTFYVPSGFVGEPDYLTLADLDRMAAAGHEIGAHSVTHPDMAVISAPEAEREACLGRATLASWGFQVTSFAYPFSSMNEAAKAAARVCGFNSARDLGDVETRFGCGGCDLSESIPPVDPFELRAPALVDATWTLQDLQSTVTNAEAAGGGWVALTFHHLCDACDPAGYSVHPSVFGEFIGWLAARAASHGTLVRTVHQVVGGAVAPIVARGFPPPIEPGVNGVVNPGLEDPPGDGAPRCWTGVGFGSSTWVYDTVSPGRTGRVAGRVVVSDHEDGDAKVVVEMDLGDCAPSVAPGRRYALGAWYTSDVPTQFSVFLRDPTGVWAYWTSSPHFPATSEFAEARWDSPPIPRGTTGLSFVLSLLEDGTLITDDHSLHRIEGPPPVVDPGTPSITGRPAVGATLTADPGTWVPATASLTYRWLRDGQPVACIGGPMYEPGPADVGAVISVRVTGTAFGYAGTSAESATTVPVQPSAGSTPTLSSAYSSLNWAATEPRGCR